MKIPITKFLKRKKKKFRAKPILTVLAFTRRKLVKMFLGETSKETAHN